MPSHAHLGGDREAVEGALRVADSTEGRGVELGPFGVAPARGGVAQEATVGVVCLARIDERAPFSSDPEVTDGLWLWEDGETAGAPHRVRRFGERFEARFEHVYRAGAFDPVLYRANSWKRAPSIRDFVLTYEGETRVLEEKVTAR